MEKVRLDSLMVEQGLAQSRERAKAMIMAGQVYIDNQKCDKAGLSVPSDAKIEVRGDTLKYVSRGGLKLEKSVDVSEMHEVNQDSAFYEKIIQEKIIIA